MRYGVVLPIQAKGLAVEELSDQLIEEAIAAEAAGFDGVFLPEFHSAREPVISSPLVLGAAILQATSTLRFGTAVLAGPLHHPVQLAEDAAMLTALSRGRFVLGLGIGHLEPDFAAFGVDRSRRSDLLDELLDGLGDVAAPIWIGAHSKRGLERAARRADCWIADPQRTVDTLATLADHYRAVATANDRPASVALFREAWIGEAEAWAPYPMAVHRLYFNVGAYRGVVDDKADMTFEQLAPGRFLVGDGPTIRATVAAWEAATGCSYLALRFRHPGGPAHDATLAALRRFGEEVIAS